MILYDINIIYESIKTVLKTIEICGFYKISKLTVVR